MIAALVWGAWLVGADEPAPIARERWVLVGAGDIGSCNGTPEATARLVERVLAANPNARVFTAGDNAYPDGRPEDYARCYAPWWGRFKDRTLAVPGNHDYKTKDARGFAEYFGFAKGQPFFRSLDVGPWHVVLLDSNCHKGVGCDAKSEQARWLEQDLQRNTKKCTLAIWHHPLFSSGWHGGEKRMRDLWQIAARGGVDLVIAGHEHTYERFDRLTADGELVPGGIASIVVGTGGAPAYKFRTPARGSLAREQGPGVLVLDLDESGAYVRFEHVDGTLRDSTRISCTP